MRANVGNIDRVFRAALGLVLLYLAFFSGMAFFDGAVARYVVGAIGIVMLIVAATRVCPVYTILGMRTCRT